MAAVKSRELRRKFLIRVHAIHPELTGARQPAGASSALRNVTRIRAADCTYPAYVEIATVMFDAGMGRRVMMRRSDI